ncbi:MAG: TIGR00341 family protein [Halobacteriales archaeon]
MRLVQVTVPAGKRGAVLETLDDEEIDYVVTEETSGQEFTAVIWFPLPQNAVEPVLEQLRSVGIDENAYTVVVTAETVVSRRFEQLEERYSEEEEATDRISREEIRARAGDLAPNRITYVVMAVVSAVIATAGVLLDSAAIVVGSMVIAPLIGPAMATSVGTVLQDRELFIRGTKLQILGFLLTVVSAAVFAWLVKTLLLVPPTLEVLEIAQVQERLAPDFLALAVALGAGIAGAYSLSSGVSTSLVGVAIAVALVPPTAVIGIGIAWGLPMVVLGSSVLVLVNFLSINLAALAMFWWQGYRPRSWFDEDAARSATIKRLAVLAAAIAVLSLFLGAVTFSSLSAATAEQDIRNDVDTVLERPAYQSLTVIEVRIRDRGTLFARQPSGVVVTVGVPPGESYPDLPTKLAQRIRQGHDVAVEVRFVERIEV